jgi:hypothetical protein
MIDCESPGASQLKSLSFFLPRGILKSLSFFPPDAQQNLAFFCPPHIRRRAVSRNLKISAASFLADLYAAIWGNPDIEQTSSMTECLIVQNATITLLFALGCYMVARYGIRCGGEANHAGKRVLSRSTQVSHRVRPVLGILCRAAK